MISRDVIKTEIDKVQDEYLPILYNIIKVFKLPKSKIENVSNRHLSINESREWNEFISNTYGCLKDDPIERI